MTAASLGIELLHHVTLTASDLARSRAFYREILGLSELERPPFPFPGAWFQIGPTQQLHLIVHDQATYRPNDQIDTHDVHFAVRVPDYAQAVAFLRSQGYTDDPAAAGPQRMKLQPHGGAGFPQIYIIDPDRHVIEINAPGL